MFWTKTIEPSHGAASVLASSPSPVPEIAAATPSDRGASLAEGLARAGWQVRQGHDGSVLFWRGATETTAAVPPVLAAMQPIAATTASDPLVEFAERLAETGWQVSRDHDGSLLLWSDVASPSLATPQPMIIRATAGSTRRDPWAQLADRLAEAGWLVSRGADDSLLLSPKA